MGQPLVVFHKGCIDGQGAAAVAMKRYPQAELCEGVYQQPLPANIAGRDVYLVDFSYPMDKLETLLESAASVTIIDHHLTAMNDLKDFEHPKLTKFLAKEHSGAVLAWKFWYPDLPTPVVLNFIEDRDLWIKAYGDTTEAICAYLYAIDFEVDTWVRFLDTQYWCMQEQKIIAAGEVLLLQERKRVVSLSKNPRWLWIGGYQVPAVNCNAYYASEVGHVLGEGKVFAATYFDIEDKRIFSLRSADTGLDVSAIARQYGGGGHFHAAGFAVSREEVVEFGWA